jgi:hypothetical protein
MTILQRQENKNSFAVDDWNTAQISSQDVFTSAAPPHRAPKKLVTFEWSLLLPPCSDEPTPAQEHQAAVDSLYGHAMTKEEAAGFRRAMKSKFVPLTPEQTRILPPRRK